MVKRLGLEKEEDEKKPSTELGAEVVPAGTVSVRVHEPDAKGSWRWKATARVTLTAEQEISLPSSLLCKASWESRTCSEQSPSTSIPERRMGR